MKKSWLLWWCCFYFLGVEGQSVRVQTAYFDPPQGLRTPVFDVRQLLFEPGLAVPEKGWGGALAHHVPGIGAGIHFSQVAACFNTGDEAWFGGVHAGGNTELKRVDFLLGASKSLGAGWRVGTTAGMGMLRAMGMEGARWPHYSIGLCRKINHSWIFTATLENPWSVPVEWRPPLLLRTGLLFAPGKYFNIKCLLITEEDQETAAFLGLQVMPAEKVWAKAGWLTGSQVLFAGFGLLYGNCAIEAGGRLHFPMGFSSSLAIHINSKRL